MSVAWSRGYTIFMVYARKMALLFDMDFMGNIQVFILNKKISLAPLLLELMSITNARLYYRSFEA